MYRQKVRQNEMVKNSEYMQALVVLEKVLDEELERLEDEYSWDCKKYVYLQALECDSAHLEHLSISMKRSRQLSDKLRTLLEDTFQEKLIFASRVKNQQQKWRLDDEQQQHHNLKLQQYQQNIHNSPSEGCCFEGYQKQDHHNFYLKLNKSQIILRKLKTRKSKSKMLLLFSQAHIFSNRWKSKEKFCKARVSEHKTARYQIPRTSYFIKRKMKSQGQQYKMTQAHRKHFTYKTEHARLEDKSERGVQNMSIQQLDDVIADVANEMSNHRQMNNQSVRLRPSDIYQSLEFDTLLQGEGHLGSQEEMGDFDWFCFKHDIEHESVIIRRTE